MKKIALFALTVLWTALASGQQLQLELPLDSNQAEGLRIAGFSHDEAGNVLVTITSRYSLHQIFLPADSSTGRPGSVTRFDLDSKKNHFLVARGLPDGIENCIANKDLTLLRFLHSGARGDHMQQTDSLVIPPDQRLFNAVYQGNTFYAIAVKKHSNTVFLYRRRPASVIETFQKEIDVKKWGVIWWHGTRNFIKNRVDNGYDLLESAGMIQADSSTAPPMSAAVFKSKCYIRQGVLYLTFDTHQLVTNVIELPLDERPSRLLQFNPEDWYHKSLPIGFSTGNSFIFDNTLITAAIVHRQPWVAFYDLSTAKLITSYAPAANGHTSFPMGPIWQAGDFWHKDKVHPIKWDDFAANAFDFWTMGITAREADSGQIEVRIGTIYNRENFGDAMMVFAAFFTPLGLITAPILEFSAPPINTMYFSSRFDQADFHALPYKESKDKSELMNTFASSQILSPKGISGFQIGNDYWMGWYDAVLQKYFIYKF